MSKKKQLLKNSALAIKVLKEDIINTKLVNGLRDLNLDAGDYALQLNKVVFELLGFEEERITEEIVDWYYHYVDVLSIQMKVKDDEELNQMAEKFYHAILEKEKDFLLA
jgi:hypothetical protein